LANAARWINRILVFGGLSIYSSFFLLVVVNRPPPWDAAGTAAVVLLTGLLVGGAITSLTGKRWAFGFALGVDLFFLVGFWPRCIEGCSSVAYLGPLPLLAALIGSLLGIRNPDQAKPV